MKIKYLILFVLLANCSTLRTDRSLISPYFLHRLINTTSDTMLVLIPPAFCRQMEFSILGSKYCDSNYSFLHDSRILSQLNPNILVFKQNEQVIVSINPDDTLIIGKNDHIELVFVEIYLIQVLSKKCKIDFPAISEKFDKKINYWVMDIPIVTGESPAFIKFKSPGPYKTKISMLNSADSVKSIFVQRAGRSIFKVHFSDGIDSVSTWTGPFEKKYIMTDSSYFIR